MTAHHPDTEHHTQDIAGLLSAAGIDFEVLYDGTSSGCPSHRGAADRAA
jgi:hypothetical protein